MLDGTGQAAVERHCGGSRTGSGRGRIVGIWKTKTLKEKLELSMIAWEHLQSSEQRELERLAEEYAAFRRLKLSKCKIDKDNGITS